MWSRERLLKIRRATVHKDLSVRKALLTKARHLQQLKCPRLDGERAGLARAIEQSIDDPKARSRVYGRSLS